MLVGSVLWILDAAWGWHPQGWMVKLWGYHDAYASGVVHAIAGGAALAFLIVLGPRIGKFRAGRDAARYTAPQCLAGNDRPVPDLHRLLGLLRRVQHSDHLARHDRRPDHRRHLDGDKYLSRADHAFGDHVQLPDVAIGRHDGWLYRLQGRSLLDVLMRAVRHHCHLGRQRSLSSDPGHADRRHHPGDLLQAALLGRDAGSRSTMRWARSRCTAMADSSAWSSRASCCGDTPSSPYEGFAHINPLGNFAGALLDVPARLHPDLDRLQDHGQHGPVARAEEGRARGCRLCAQPELSWPRSAKWARPRRR